MCIVIEPFDFEVMETQKSLTHKICSGRNLRANGNEMLDIV